MNSSLYMNVVLMENGAHESLWWNASMVYEGDHRNKIPNS